MAVREESGGGGTDAVFVVGVVGVVGVVDVVSGVNVCVVCVRVCVSCFFNSDLS